jgi:hypothetical protein
MKKHASLSRAAMAAALAIAVLGPASFRSLAFTGGPPAGFTNAPFESNCTLCHSSFPLDSGSAVFEITPPAAWVPNANLPVSVTFSNTYTPKHGFQITARDGSGSFNGTWQVVMTSLTKNATGSLSHHEHTAAGTVLTAWTMEWIAPAALPNGPVTFYACGNEANANNATSGDRIYSAKAKLYQATLSTPSPGWSIASTRLVTISAPTHGGEQYAIVPSDDPTPVSLGGPFEIEVNPFSGFFALALQSPQFFSGIMGTLDPAGQAAATVFVPDVPALQGLSLYFGGVTFDANGPTEVTKRLTVKFH